VAYYGAKILKHIDRPDSQDANPAQSQPFVANGVALRLIPARMDSTIDLDSKIDLRTVEVEHIGPGRMLVSELQFARPFPKLRPQ